MDPPSFNLKQLLLNVEDWTDVRVSFLDTDALNIVQFPQYLVYFEEGLVSLLRKVGFEAGQVFAERGLAFPVKELSVKYHKQAHFDEILEIKSRFTSVGATSLITESKAIRGADLVAEGTSVRVCVNSRTGEKVPLVEAFDRLT